jgi:hypothetical protein
MDALAYTNLDYKMSQHPDPVVGKLIKTQQAGAQYLLFLTELAKKRATLYASEAEKERLNIAKMRELKKK